MVNKLELTWIGKDEPIRPEPRIFIEDKSKSYGDQNTENMLIHGDNLLALKSLESKFTGKVKCVYIDPPYNTGSAFEYYDDNLEHSVWLNLMRPRLEILKNLLSDDGSIWISIDEEESHYLKVLCDEVFNRNNFVIQIAIQRGAATGHKAINPTPVQVCDYILVYAKHKNKFIYKQSYKKRDYDKAYSQFIENFEQPYENWKFISLKEAEVKYNFKVEKQLEKYADRIIRFAQPDYNGVGRETRELIDQSKQTSSVILQKRTGYPDIYLFKGDRILFYKDKMRMIDGKLVTAELVTNLWTDMNYQGIAKEGGVIFKKGKKPEIQIRRILEMSTNEGDLVLDSFLGSGTTAAVAHKMNRRWIGIEMGSHAYTHCKSRLDKIVDGTDNSGITKSIGWAGGGGYRFYELAPTLINIDKLGCAVISSEYNSDMLAAAIALHEGFEYVPDETVFWKQARFENSYLFTTTQHITIDYLSQIISELSDNEYLTIAAKSFDEGLNKIYKNIKIKKIPNMLLNRCEFGKDDYSFDIVSLLEQEGDHSE